MVTSPVHFLCWGQRFGGLLLCGQGDIISLFSMELASAVQLHRAAWHDGSLLETEEQDCISLFVVSPNIDPIRRGPARKGWVDFLISRNSMNSHMNLSNGISQEGLAPPSARAHAMNDTKDTGAFMLIP